jgi:hypothetical protein
MIQLSEIKPVNIDKVLGKTRNRVRRIGIELEGGWTKLPPGTKLTHDGSVVFQPDELVPPIGGPVIKMGGELPSPPLEMEMWMAWMKQFYPHKVNATCGMHVHLSFRTALTYQRLMTASYPATLIAYVTAWAKDEKLDKTHPLWPRLRGESEYCQHIFSADDQVRSTGKDHDRHRRGHRYSVVNYCYGRHSTLECRLLPMMTTVEQSISAIQNVIDITNAYLVTMAAREEKLKAVHVVDQERIRDERKIYI